MKRIAIPIKNNNSSDYFGQCDFIEIYEIEGKVVTSKRTETPPTRDVELLSAWISDQGITDVITYKINKQAILLFSENKVNVFIGISINSPQKLIEEYVNGTLKSNEQIITELLK